MEVVFLAGICEEVRIIPQRHAKHAKTHKAIPPGQRHVKREWRSKMWQFNNPEFTHLNLSLKTCGELLSSCPSRRQVCRLLQPMRALAAMLDDSSCSSIRDPHQVYLEEVPIFWLYLLLFFVVEVSNGILLFGNVC